MPTALKGDALAAREREVPDWKVVDEHHLNKSFKFPDFLKALEFVNRVGAIAEEMGHHPNIEFTWGKAEITIFTHDVDGLTGKDFALAAKINQLG